MLSADDQAHQSFIFSFREYHASSTADIKKQKMEITSYRL